MGCNASKPLNGASAKQAIRTKSSTVHPVLKSTTLSLLDDDVDHVSPTLLDLTVATRTVRSSNRKSATSYQREKIAAARAKLSIIPEMLLVNNTSNTHPDDVAAVLDHTAGGKNNLFSDLNADTLHTFKSADYDTIKTFEVFQEDGVGGAGDFSSTTSYEFANPDIPGIDNFQIFTFANGILMEDPEDLILEATVFSVDGSMSLRGFGGDTRRGSLYNGNSTLLSSDTGFASMSTDNYDGLNRETATGGGSLKAYKDNKNYNNNNSKSSQMMHAASASASSSRAHPGPRHPQPQHSRIQRESFAVEDMTSDGPSDYYGNDESSANNDGLHEAHDTSAPKSHDKANSSNELEVPQAQQKMPFQDILPQASDSTTTASKPHRQRQRHANLTHVRRYSSRGNDSAKSFGSRSATVHEEGDENEDDDSDVSSSDEYDLAELKVSSKQTNPIIVSPNFHDAHNGQYRQDPYDPRLRSIDPSMRQVRYAQDQQSGNTMITLDYQEEIGPLNPCTTKNDKLAKDKEKINGDLALSLHDGITANTTHDEEDDDDDDDSTQPASSSSNMDEDDCLQPATSLAEKMSNANDPLQDDDDVAKSEEFNSCDATYPARKSTPPPSTEKEDFTFSRQTPRSRRASITSPPFRQGRPHHTRNHGQGFKSPGLRFHQSPATLAAKAAVDGLRQMALASPHPGDGRARLRSRRSSSNSLMSSSSVISATSSTMSEARPSFSIGLRPPFMDDGNGSGQIQHGKAVSSLHTQHENLGDARDDRTDWPDEDSSATSNEEYKEEMVESNNEEEGTWMFDEIQDEEFKRLCTKLRKKINLDPWDEFKKFDDEDLCDFVKTYPLTCRVRYPFDNFTGKLFPLSVVCAMGPEAKTVEAILEAYEPALYECDVWIGTPLHYACSYKASKMVVRKLVERDIGMLERMNQYGRTPLHMACLFRASSNVIAPIIKLFPTAALLQDANDGYTPLHLATENGTCVETVKALLQVDPVRVGTALTNTKESTPLHLACATTGNMSNATKKAIIRALVEGCPVAVDHLDVEGQLPLHLAVQSKLSVETISLLVKTFPGSVDVANNKGQTPFDIAKRKRLPETILDVLSGV